MRPTILLLATALSLASMAGEAAAHARLIKSDPKAGSTVPAPRALKLMFSESIVASQSSVSVTGPSGAVATGKLALDPKDRRQVTVPLAASLAAGAYKVNWSMKTEDTHTMSGQFGFTAR